MGFNDKIKVDDNELVIRANKNFASNYLTIDNISTDGSMKSYTGDAGIILKGAKSTATRGGWIYSSSNDTQLVFQTDTYSQGSTLTLKHNNGSASEFTGFAQGGNGINLGSTSKKWNNGYFGGIVEAANIPAPPTSDGEYNLHCSIVGGVPTYTWEAE